MPKNDYEHHQPRKQNKVKKIFGDELTENRLARVSFKNYLRQIKEEAKMIDDDDFVTITILEEQTILDDFADWSAGNSPEDCTDAQLQEYVSMCELEQFDPVEILSFLRNYSV